MKCIFLVILTFSTCIGFGQTGKFNFKLGSEFEYPAKAQEFAFFGNDKDGIVHLAGRKDEFVVSLFEQNTLKQTGEKIIPMQLRESSGKSTVEYISDFGGYYYRLVHVFDKGSKSEILYYDKIDVTKGTHTTSANNLIEIPKMAGYGFRFREDVDRKHLLVNYRVFPQDRNDKKNYDKLGFHVFDEHMNKIWGNEFTMPYTEAVMDNNDYAVDIRGSAYLLTKVYDSDKRKELDKETGKAAYHFEVFKFSKGEIKPTSTVVSVGDYFLREVSLIENSMHDMVVACTYSKTAKGKGTDGIFLATIDKDGNLIKFKNGYYEFPMEELLKNESTKHKRLMERKTDYEIQGLRVRNIVVEKDGSVFIAFEQYWADTKTYNVNGRTYNESTYHYDDILAAKIKANGELAWFRKIPKRQKGENAFAGTMSYKLVSDVTGYYFLYLDNKKNMELQDDDVPKYHVDGYGGQVVVSKIDNSGTVTKELLFDTREEDLMFFPSEFTRINGNQFIGMAKMKKGGYQPLLITVN